MHASKHVLNTIHYSRGLSSAMSCLDGEWVLNGWLLLKLAISKEVLKVSDASGLARIEKDTRDGVDIWDLLGLSVGWLKYLL